MNAGSEISSSDAQIAPMPTPQAYFRAAEESMSMARGILAAPYRGGMTPRKEFNKVQAQRAMAYVELANSQLRAAEYLQEAEMIERSRQARSVTPTAAMFDEWRNGR